MKNTSFTVIDVETACDVKECVDYGKSICRDGHGLSPWHSKLTQVGLMAFYGEKELKSSILNEHATIEEIQWQIDNNFPKAYVGHSFKFDALHLMSRGLKLDLELWIGDTQLAAYVCTEKTPEGWLDDYNRNLPKGLRKGTPHSLKTLAPYILGVPAYWEIAGHDDAEYLLKDLRYTGGLHSYYEAKLRDLQQHDFYRNKQLEWTKLLLEAELRGIAIDMELMQTKEQELKERSVILKQKLDEVWKPAHEAYTLHLAQELGARYGVMMNKAVAKLKDPSKAAATRARYSKMALEASRKLPDGIDYDSPKQMLWLLRDYYGYNCTSLEGEEGTGREILERLADEGHEDVRTYLEWRKANKILTAFLPTYKQLAVKGNLHPIFNPDSTRTGRTSSERPNCQQVPPALRSLFKARDGYCFIGYDAGAIEAKLIAAYTQDETLYNIIKDGVSLHNFNTKTWLELDCDVNDVPKLYPNERSASKNVGFAQFYNAGWNRVRIAFAQKGIHLSERECRQINQRFKESFKEAKTVADEVVRYMEEGNVFENLFGRPLKVQDPQEAYMKAFNMLIQSSASDLNLEGARKANIEFKRRNIEAYPILFVHDFVCFEVKKEHAVEADEILKKELTNFVLTTRHGPIELTIEGGISDRWEK